MLPPPTPLRTSPVLSRRRLAARLGAVAALAAPGGLAACAPPLRGLSGGTGEPGPGEVRRSQAADLPGRILYVGDSDIWLWERGAARRLTGDRISRQPVWSPDGKWIAHIKL